MSRLRARTTSVTHPGLIRSANEDSLLAREGEGVWVVADGMGGHANGQWASSVVVDAASRAPLRGEFDADVATLAAALQSANTHIYTAAKANGAQMGSTAVLLHLQGDRFAGVWAGDSRIYLVRDGRLHRLSRDHTQVQEMVDRGLLTPEEAERHPMGHVLSRAVGVQEALELDAVTDQALPRDIFLLCSDGLSGYVSEPEMVERLSTLPAQTACKRLLELVLARGAPDNVTMIVVTCEEATAVSFSAPV